MLLPGRQQHWQRHQQGQEYKYEYEYVYECSYDDNSVESKGHDLDYDYGWETLTQFRPRRATTAAAGTIAAAHADVPAVTQILTIMTTIII